MIKKLLRTYRRRPFPVNLHSLRACRISYSQFGEDLFLTQLLGYERTHGTYVDVGCFHPIRFSNTYIFYQRGWSGLAIDPNIEWKSAWHRFRPRDRFVCAAVSSEERQYNYIRDSRHPACNRLTAEANPELSENESATSINSCRIDQLLEENIGEARQLDLMNIDCEGYDIEILRDLDFAKWQPSVVAAEDHTPSLESELSNFMSDKGYRCKSHIGLTKVFQHRSNK